MWVQRRGHVFYQGSTDTQIQTQPSSVESQIKCIWTNTMHTQKEICPLLLHERKQAFMWRDLHRPRKAQNHLGVAVQAYVQNMEDLTSLYTLQYIYKGRNLPHVTSGHAHVWVTHMYVHKENGEVFWPGINARANAQHASINVQSTWRCKHAGNTASFGIAHRSEREAMLVLLAHAPASSWAFFPSCFIFFPAAEQTPCLQGRCLMRQIQSLECLISCGQACFWQLTFPTACCWKIHTPQTINTMVKT